MKLLFMNGPNLNLLGTRDPEIYGRTTLKEVEARCREIAREAGCDLVAFQSNHEGALIDAIHSARGRCAAIVFNPGAFTHYAYALADALAAFEGIVVELHLSNPHAREAWRHTSVIVPVATGTIAGFGAVGYRLAIDAVADKIEETT